MPLPERELIARIHAAAGTPAGGRRAALVRGIGDDCAVLRVPVGNEVLVTTDFSLEGVHFRREWHPAEAVGHRCLARGLSDIAAMGGGPLAAFLSLALPGEVAQSWVDAFLRGFLRLARRFQTPLAGGDTANSRSGILADIIVLGSTPRGRAVLRSGARAGDDIYVTGTLGAAMAILRELRDGGKPGLRLAAGARSGSRRSTRFPRAAEQKHFYPVPRLAVSRWLRERRLVSAMIDISDGLSTDLSHICAESGVGAWIAEAAVPVAPGATLQDALHGGDEYELLFTAPAAKHRHIPERIAGVPVRWIGAVTRARGMWLVAPDMKARRELRPKGWEHFVHR